MPKILSQKNYLQEWNNECSCNAPKILFLDEPTSDPTTSKMIYTLLQELKQAGTTIFLDHGMICMKQPALRIAYLFE